jgi:hypothetical protein
MGKRSYENLVNVTTVLLFMFKVFVLGGTLIVYSAVLPGFFGWVSMIAIAISGIAWVAGIQNMLLFYNLFRR